VQCSLFIAGSTGRSVSRRGSAAARLRGLRVRIPPGASISVSDECCVLSGRVGQRPLACWDCEFESRRGHLYLSLMSVVRCHVEVSATGRSLVQRSSTECAVSKCDLEASLKRRS
jgi:hypothetical protein